MKLGFRNYAIDEPELEGFCGFESLAKQYDLHRLLQSDQARQGIRHAAIRSQAEVTIRRREITRLRGNRKIASAHQRKAEARHRTMYAGEHRVRHPLQVFDGRMHMLDHPRELVPTIGRRARKLVTEGANIAASHEMPTGALDDYATQAVVGGERRAMCNQGVDHL